MGWRKRGTAVDELLYLRPNVQVEPLVDQWYAWAHLIPPATMARNMTERHLKIMDSYVNASHVHAAAVKNPRMLGGPFIDYGGKRVGEIRALRDRTREERAKLRELSDALVELDTMLASEAKGYSLNSLYPRVPPPLQGRVELVYDLNNNASFRLLEALLYRSKYYDPSLQSFMLSTVSSDDRPFVLSTPRLQSNGEYHWRRPFRDEAVDALFRLKYQPRPYGSIRASLGLAGEAEDLFRSFLTPAPPPPYEPYRGPTARWRYFGHACVLVETPQINMLFDPVLSYTYETDISRYTYLDLPETIDYVLITHNHQDHVLFETLLQIRNRTRNIVVPRGGGTLQDPSLRHLLEQIGFMNVIEIGEMDEIPIGDGTITGLPFLGEHADLDIRTKIAYLVKTGRHSLLFAADSCNIDPKLYAHLHREVGDVDALFLGMECNGAPLTWLYGPLLSHKLERAMDQSRRLAGSDFEQAVQIVDEFRCKEVYVYAMGQEPWLNHVMSLKYTEESKPIVDSNRLIAYCHDLGIAAERLFGEREMFLN
jgi:L-ascorbate metabolism protein UlaG (beta-lactamase superfamily)